MVWSYRIDPDGRIIISKITFDEETGKQKSEISVFGIQTPPSDSHWLDKYLITTPAALKDDWPYFKWRSIGENMEFDLCWDVCDPKLENKFIHGPEKMNDRVFDILMSDTFEYCKTLLGSKGTEYSRGSRLDAFHKAGQYSNQSPEKALFGFLLKHEISIRDIVEDLDKDILPSNEKLNEKITDIINYYVLLKALIVERKG